MTVDETRALIAEVRQEESIQDKLGDGFSEGSEERAFYYEHRDRYKRLADALEAATRELAAVPDAATCDQKAHDTLNWNLNRLSESNTGLSNALTAAVDERDAALAAIERIREAVSGHPECDRYEEGDVISCGWKSAYASVVAALGVAPEPEEEP